LPITDEAELHLGDHAEHSQDHAAIVFGAILETSSRGARVVES
jgi:hypothetical protein